MKRSAAATQESIVAVGSPAASDREAASCVDEVARPFRTRGPVPGQSRLPLTGSLLELQKISGRRSIPGPAWSRPAKTETPGPPVAGEGLRVPTAPIGPGGCHLSRIASTLSLAVRPKPLVGRAGTAFETCAATSSPLERQRHGSRDGLENSFQHGRQFGPRFPCLRQAGKVREFSGSLRPPICLCWPFVPQLDRKGCGLPSLLSLCCINVYLARVGGVQNTQNANAFTVRRSKSQYRKPLCRKSFFNFGRSVQEFFGSSMPLWRLRERPAARPRAAPRIPRRRARAGVSAAGESP